MTASIADGSSRKPADSSRGSDTPACLTPPPDAKPVELSYVGYRICQEHVSTFSGSSAKARAVCLPGPTLLFMCNAVNSLSSELDLGITDGE